ncbi:MAG: S-layer protein [Candidatus Argoarchaeum ethanivorans]|uniref:S-layer protein n=1 Tax=Candidatus Argoarchaeum ethanivorans TaxID=2608793 RepID=A0A811T970_9EURY|nr:MAG: S-layer protein [Candidatus Argoarchaeum ethanivorans]
MPKYHLLVLVSWNLVVFSASARNIYFTKNNDGFLYDVENKIKRTIKVKHLTTERSYLLLITLFFISVMCTCQVASADDRISFEFPLETGDSIYFEDGYYKVTLVGTEWQFGWALLNISCDSCLYEPREVYGRKNETIHYPSADNPVISITNTRDVSRDSARVTISFPERWSYKLVTGEEVDKVEVNKVEIRGDVYDNLTNHKPNATGKGIASWNSYNFAGFFYDFDTDFWSETLTVESASGRSIDENDLVYESNPININFEHDDWGKYDLIGFMAEEYFAAYNNTIPVTSKDLLSKGYLSKVLIDEDDKHTITIGSTLPLKEGYALKAIDISVNDTLVRFVLLKDGEEVSGSDEIVDKGKNYVYEKKIGNVSDVPIIIVYVETVFHGRETDAAFIHGVFQISENPIEIETGDTYGIMEVKERSGKIIMKNRESISLDAGDMIDVMGEVRFKVADSDELRFYPFIDCSGYCEIRGMLTNGTETQTWDSYSFAGLYYDLDQDIKTEKLEISGISGRTIEKGNLTYQTHSTHKYFNVYKYKGLLVNGEANYSVIGWKGEQYAAINEKANKIARIVVEQDNTPSDKKTLTIGETWDIGDGWSLTAQGIDARATPRQAWLVLSKDGVKLEDEVVADGDVVTYQEDLSGESDVPLFVTYVDSVFVGATSDMVQLRYTWAISPDVTIIKSGDEFGKLEVINATQKKLILNNNYNFSLDPESTKHIIGKINFKIADSSSLRFYPFIAINSFPPSPLPAAWSGIARWNLYENYTFALIDIDAKSSPRQAWLQLSKDDYVIEDIVVRPGDIYRYNGTHCEIFSAKMEAIFKGTATDLVRLTDVCQYSETNGSLLINNNTYLFIHGSPDRQDWEIYENYNFSLLDIDAGATPRQAWLQLSKNNVTVMDRVVVSGDCFSYGPNTTIFSACVGDIFWGMNSVGSKLVTLEGVYQYSEIDKSVLINNATYLFMPEEAAPLETAELEENYNLSLMDIDARATPREAWLQISNGTHRSNAIVHDGERYTDGALEIVIGSVFHGGKSTNMVLLSSVRQHSTNDTLILNQSMLLADQYPNGEIWALHENYALNPREIDAHVYPRQVWFTLLKNGTPVYDTVMSSKQVYTYYKGSMKVFTADISTVFHGTETDAVFLRDIKQYSELDGREFADLPHWYPVHLTYGYDIAAKQINWSTIALQLSKNNRIIDEGIFSDTFMLKDSGNQITVSGSLDSHNVTQYYNDTEVLNLTNVTLKAGYSKKTLYTSPRSLKISITSPIHRLQRNPITFASSVIGGTPPYSYNWTSTINNYIGSTDTFSRNLSNGSHTITAKVTDGRGVTATDSVVISFYNKLRGDVNSDTQITSADAAIVLEIAVGSSLCNPGTLAVADVSGDGKVTSLDALMILQQIR